MNENARGRDIIDQILENMRSQTEELRYSRFVSSSYNVHLHPDDYARLEGLVPQVVFQARRALDEELARLNRAPAIEDRVRKLIGRTRIPYERPSPEWSVRILPDPNDELAPGDILVDATLVAPESERFAGSRTQRMVTHRHGDTVERRATEGESAQAVATPPAVAAPPALARLRWQDEKGEHEFRMTSPHIKVGRGGQGYWVDLRLDTIPDVSREHLRIRLDEASGRFHVQDLSSYGTTVDGVAIPPRAEGAAAGEESPLPSNAMIGLAGVVFLRFESESRAG